MPMPALPNMKELHSTIKESLKHLHFSLHREGVPFVCAFAIVALILYAIATPLGWLGIFLTCWCTYFFRDPERVTPDREGLIVSPADGVVQAVVQAPLPQEVGGDGRQRTRVSVFLNILDVHVNRVPISGTVSLLHYHPGRFLNASLDKASEDNERQTCVVTTGDGKDIVFVQIAGLIARRIVCLLKERQSVRTGERFGIIRFGSRVDVYLPEGVAPLVIPGQRVIGGETVLADTTSGEPPRRGAIR